MPNPDLNLLVTLDVLLTEGSVARAAQRLRLSPSAMSRSLARLRKALGDPLLVRAGRGLVPTPRALELRERVTRLVDEGREVLRPNLGLDLKALERTFTLRTSDGFVENFGPELVNLLRREAPGVRLCFLQKHNKDSGPLRKGTVDLETGVIEETIGPEIMSRALFKDRFVGAVRLGHPMIGKEITLGIYSAARHVGISRTGQERGIVDTALEQFGGLRDITVIVSGFGAALSLARFSDLIATVPEQHTKNLRAGMHSFPLPFPSPEIVVSLLWHPRLDSDPAHRWLRGVVWKVCNETLADSSVEAQG